MRILAAILILLTSTAAYSEESERDELLRLARDTINEARYCALITVDGEGQPRARTVDPFKPDDDFVIWIATRPNTRKVEQIRGHDQVTLYYFDAMRRNYVTVMGTARIVDDVEVKKAKRRAADSDSLYPNFPDDYLLIEVTPNWLEAMVPGYRGDRDNWRPAGVSFPLESAAAQSGK